MTTKQDALYHKFCEVLASNDAPCQKFIKIQSMIADSVLSVDAIENDRNLKVDPDGVRKRMLMDKYYDYMQTITKQEVI